MKCAACGGIASFDLENRIDLVGADGKVLRGPAKDFGIEILGGSLVGGGELDPGKCAWGVSFDGRYSGESVLPGGEGSKTWRILGRARAEGYARPLAYDIACNIIRLCAWCWTPRC
jgi:hypothetical protein